MYRREKRWDLTQSYDKSPYIQRKIQKGTRQHKNATKNFDYTTIADRLRTVSLGNDGHPTGVVKPVNGIQTPPPHSPQYLCSRGHEHIGIILQSAEISISIVSTENDIEKIFLVE